MDRAQVSNKDFASSLSLVFGTGLRRDAKFQAIAELLSNTFGKAGVGIYQYLGDSPATLAEAAIPTAHRNQTLGLLNHLQAKRPDGYLKLDILKNDGIRLVGMNLFANPDKAPVGCLVVIFPALHHIPWETQKLLVIAKEFIQAQLLGDWHGAQGK